MRYQFEEDVRRALARSLGRVSTGEPDFGELRGRAIRASRLRRGGFVATTVLAFAGLAIGTSLLPGGAGPPVGTASHPLPERDVPDGWRERASWRYGFSYLLPDEWRTYDFYAWEALPDSRHCLRSVGMWCIVHPPDIVRGAEVGFGFAQAVDRRASVAHLLRGTAAGHLDLTSRTETFAGREWVVVDEREIPNPKFPSNHPCIDRAGETGPCVERHYLTALRPNLFLHFSFGTSTQDEFDRYAPLAERAVRTTILRDPAPPYGNDAPPVIPSPAPTPMSTASVGPRAAPEGWTVRISQYWGFSYLTPGGWLPAETYRHSYGQASGKIVPRGAHRSCRDDRGPAPRLASYACWLVAPNGGEDHDFSVEVTVAAARLSPEVTARIWAHDVADYREETFAGRTWAIATSFRKPTWTYPCVIGRTGRCAYRYYVAPLTTRHHIVVVLWGDGRMAFERFERIGDGIARSLEFRDSPDRAPPARDWWPS